MQRTRLFVTGFFLANLAFSPAAWAQGAGNFSSVGQQGRGNAAGIQQTGSGNEAGLLQFGRANTGIITQEGNGNGACLVQMGRNLSGAIEQVGDYQTTGVLQTRRGTQDIPLELCATAKTRGHVLAYVSGRGSGKVTVGGPGRSVR